MAGQEEISDPRGESFIDTTAEKISAAGDSSSFEPEEKTTQLPPVAVETKERSFSLFGRQKPVHKAFGGGKAADIFLWRNKKLSTGALVGATAVWILFELLDYHLLALLAHILIFALGLLFLWSNASVFINKRTPHIPEVHLPEEPFLEVASALRTAINRALSELREIASGRDLKKFLIVVAGLWILSIVGSFCNFLTLAYISFVSLLTVPILYEKYDDKIDRFVEKAAIEIKHQYAVFDAKVLSKIPKVPLERKRD